MKAQVQYNRTPDKWITLHIKVPKCGYLCCQHRRDYSNTVSLWPKGLLKPVGLLIHCLIFTAVLHCLSLSPYVWKSEKKTLNQHQTVAGSFLKKKEEVVAVSLQCCLGGRWRPHPWGRCKIFCSSIYGCRIILVDRDTISSKSAAKTNIKASLPKPQLLWKAAERASIRHSAAIRREGLARTPPVPDSPTRSHTCYRSWSKAETERERRWEERVVTLSRRHLSPASSNEIRGFTNELYSERSQLWSEGQNFHHPNVPLDFRSH